MARDDFTAKVKREIINYSSGQCMICRNKQHSPKIAHIIPASANGPRCEYRSTHSEDFIKSPENGLCLCQNCHDLIDDDGLNTYSLQELKSLNKKYQKDYKISEEYKLLLGISDSINYNELKNFYESLLQTLDMTDEENQLLITSRNTFLKIPIDEKIKKNELFPRQAREIKKLYAFEFQAYKKTLENSSIVSEKIKSAIIILFLRIKESDKSKKNSEIFDEMLSLMYDPSNQIIGNKIVLVYFFIVCEVFKI